MLINHDSVLIPAAVPKQSKVPHLQDLSAHAEQMWFWLRFFTTQPALSQPFSNCQVERKTHLLQRWPKRWKWTVRAWVKPERQKLKVLQEQGKKQKERERVKIKSQKEVKRLLRRCSMPWPLSGGQQKIGSLVMILLMMRSRRKKDVDKTTQVLLDPGGLSRRGGLSNDVYNNYRSIQGLFLGVVIYAALEGRGQKEQTRFGQSYPWAWAFTVASCLETLWTIFLWLFQQTLEPRVKALAQKARDTSNTLHALKANDANTLASFQSGWPFHWKVLLLEKR